MTELNSRARMLRAIRNEEVDHIPCCFMSFAVLRKRLNEDRYAVAKAELEMGLDTMLVIPTASRPQRADHPDLRGLPIHPLRGPHVVQRERREVKPDGEVLLHKVYSTPAGELSTRVSLSADWPHGDHIPFVDDYQIPRNRKPLITQAQELEALQFLLQTPDAGEVAAFQQETAQAQAFAEANGVLLAGGWGVGLDMAFWLCGMQSLMLLMMDQPVFVVDLLEMIHRWNMRRMAVVLAAPVDLYIRRAWYEGVDFVTPQFYRKAILPRLKAEVDLAHDHGVKFGYICTSGTRPLLDYYLEAGIDVLIGVDPAQGTFTDLPLLKQKLGGRVCLWGGVSAAVTVEQGTEYEVRQAVQQAVARLGPQGFILSPVDNLTVAAPLTWENIDVFIDEWRKDHPHASRAATMLI